MIGNPSVVLDGIEKGDIYTWNESRLTWTFVWFWAE
jgi:hypothetical protein